MGSIIPLKKEIDNSYIELKNLVEDKLEHVDQQIKYRLTSEINLIHKMTNYHLKSGGKRIRPLLTLVSAKLCGYKEGSRDINLAACVELIHNATLLHDDVIDNSELRRGIKTSNFIWGNQSSILVGDYILSRCFEMMVEDGSLEILKLLSSTSSKIAQGEVLQLEYKGEIDNSYIELKNLVRDKLDRVNQRIKYKLASEIDLIHKITNYHLKSGGKRIRPLLTLGSAKLCGYAEGDRDINLAACVELIHNATLLHDDVIDNSDLRRGIKTSNVIWGNQSSILVGDYLLSRCFEMMVEDGNQEVLKLLSSTSSKIAQGEVSQLEYKGEIDMLEETYFKIINSKTAALFAAATRVGACITNKNRKEKDALESYGRNIGLAFQIADDALDYYSTNKIFGKEIGKDFYEGKVTLPAIFLHQKANLSERIFLEKIFKKKNRSEKEFIQMQSLIKKYDSISDCFKRAEHFVNISYNALSIFNSSKEKSILQNLTSFSLERSF